MVIEFLVGVFIMQSCLGYCLYNMCRVTFVELLEIYF